MLHALSVVYAIICAMQDFHRKLEIEKVERRQSDSQALQLLEEVREQGKIAQQLREGEARSVRTLHDVWQGSNKLSSSHFKAKILNSLPLSILPSTTTMNMCALEIYMV